MTKRKSKKASRNHGLSTLNAAMGIGLVLIIYVLANILGSLHYKRWDWSLAQPYALSEKTTKLLSELNRRVDMVIFLTPAHPFYKDVRHLVEEYEYCSDQLNVEWVDPDRDPGRAEDLASRYNIEEANSIVFACEGFSETIHAEQLAEYEYVPSGPNALKPVLKAFTGEQAFTSAIQAVSEKYRPVLYWLEGHGERSLNDSSQRNGYSEMAKRIEQDHIDWRSLELAVGNKVPDDCNVLVIAAPRLQLAHTEIIQIKQYLKKGGRILLLMEEESDDKFRDMLEDWGVLIGRDMVVDSTRTRTGRELFINTYGSHPITQGLEGISTVLYLPVSVRPETVEEQSSDQADQPQITVLAQSSEQGWAESDLESRRAVFSEQDDIDGPISVAVAVERGPVPGADVNIRSVRLVVVGDADFAANGKMVGANPDFFMNAVNWLLERNNSIAIAPKPRGVTRLTLETSQKKRLLLFAIAWLPGAVLPFGFLIWLARRR